MKSLTCNYGVISAISQVKYCLMQVLALKIITSFSESESSPDHWISENIDGTPWIWMRATTEDHIGVTIVSRLEDGRQHEVITFLASSTRTSHSMTGWAGYREVCNIHYLLVSVVTSGNNGMAKISLCEDFATGSANPQRQHILACPVDREFWEFITGYHKPCCYKRPSQPVSFFIHHLFHP